MLIDEIKSYTDGDLAINKKYRAIYDWHLTHASESKCIFTDKSMVTAIKRNDIKLLKQLIDFGVEFDISSDIDINDKTDILSKCTNTDIWELMLSTYPNKQYFISIYMMFICHRPIIKYLYDGGHMNDYNLHSLILYTSYIKDDNLTIIDNLKYISDKGYKWSIKYCQIDNIDLIKYLWRNGNNTDVFEVYDIGFDSYKLWKDLYTGDHTYYKLVKSIDPLIDKFMIDHLLGFELSYYPYVEIMDYIRNDIEDYNVRCSNDSAKLFHKSIISMILEHYNGELYDSYNSKFIDKLDLLRKVKLLSLCINKHYDDQTLKLFNMYKNDFYNYFSNITK